MTELATALTGLEQSGGTVRVFLRDDDADIDEPTLRNLVDVCLKRRAALTLAVIPATLTREGSAYLRSVRREHPDLIELHQHGWSHTNHETVGRKCEFGPARSYDLQYRDIARGEERMNNEFGTDWLRAFTPPWNRCTADTCRVLADLRFDLLSTDKYLGGRYPFRELPITVDLYRWKSGAALKSSTEVCAEITRQVAPGATVGLLLHHKVMDSAAFTALDDLLGMLSRSSAVRFETFSQRLRDEE